MTIYSSTFSATGQSSSIVIGENEKIDLAVISADWTTNRVSLQKKVASSGWETIETYSANYEGTVENLKQGTYRLNCTAYSASITYILKDHNDVLKEYENQDGQKVFRINEDGVESIGNKWKKPVVCASTANGTLATAYVAGQTVDGVTLVKGDRILLKNQTSGAENGIYEVNVSGAPSRTWDGDSAEKLLDAIIPVQKGTVNGDKTFKITNDAITLGTTSLTFQSTSVNLDSRQKEAAVVATAAAGTLATSFANGQTVDGVSLTTGDRILIKDQADGSENGIYVVAATGAPTRAQDANTAAALLDAIIPVRKGTANSDKIFKCTNDTITLDTTSLTFKDISSNYDSKWKEAVVCATTTNGTLATAYQNGQTVDGVTLATGDRILIKDQTTGAENGIYTVNASGAPTRALDADTGNRLVDAIVPVQQGTLNADRTFKVTNNSITLDSTALTIIPITPNKKIVIPCGGKVGATAGFVVNNGDDVSLATCPESKTAATLIVAVQGLKQGDIVTGFSLLGQIESAGNGVTVDADLRKHGAVAADVSDASLGTITQISVTADTAITVANSSKTLTTPEVIDDGETLYVKITVTTGASTDVAIMGIVINLK